VPGHPTTLPVSWAQHWEDVRLWRILRDRDPGFYVDVGAMDPDEDSVTKVLYGFGWRGIDVEPDPTYAARLREDRPEDLVVEAAASDRDGEIVLYRVVLADGSLTGLSTLDGTLAGRHVEEGKRFERLSVRRVLLEHVMAGTMAEEADRFDLLKVDVEGHEAGVIRGMGLERFRPLIIVIEAREPNRPVDAYAEAEGLVLAARYELATDDGLNRWYVREEDRHLAAVLRPEINPLTDGTPRRAWEVANERELQAWVERTETDVRRKTDALERTQEELERTRDESARLQEELAAILASRSWRITAPLRAIGRRVRRAR
jgi:FkbM family methyltransferase